MSKGRVIIIIALALLAACKKQTRAHMPQAQMVLILADLHLADAYSGMIRDTAKPTLGKNYDSLALWTRSILAKHHCTQQDFSSSMDWYRDHPDELDSLYARIVPILEYSKK